MEHMKMLLPLFPLYITCVAAASHTNDFPQNLARPFGAARRSIRSEAETPVCETEECRTIAQILKDSINERVDPCEDFYEYACGGWAKHKSSLSEDGPWYFIQKAQKELIIKAIDLLKGNIHPDDLSTVKLSKRYYHNCIDQEQTEKDGLGPLIATLSKAGGWPMIMEPGEWSEDIYLWQNVDDYYARLTGEIAFHKITVDHLVNTSRLSITYRDLPEGSNRLFFNISSDMFDARNGSKEQDHMEPSRDDVDSQESKSQEFSMKKFKTSVESRRNYTGLITKVAMAIADARGINVSSQQLAKDIDDMVEFMIELRDAMVEPVTKNYMSLLELHKWYNTLQPIHENAMIDWLNKIMLLFSETNIDISSDIKIQINPQYYFENLRALLNRTSRRTIVNYIHWQFVSDVIKVTTKKMKKLHEEMISTGSSYEPTQATEEELSRRCMSEIEMSRLLCYVFTKRYFSEAIVNEANKVISFIKKQVEADILQSDWLDEVSKNNALGIARSMKEVMQPCWNNNASVLEGDYQGLTVGSTRFDNFLSSKRYKMRRILRTLTENEPASFTSQVVPLTFDASYYRAVNIVLLTPADFQEPFFSLLRPSIINYGIIGTIIAHEMHHAFHNDGVSGTSDKQKNWYATVNDAYQKRVKCFVNQFNNYTEKYIGPSLDYGELTRDENIADTMGLGTTLAGYYLNMKEERNATDQTLPGLEQFNVEQLFYLSFALIHCKADRIQEESKDKTNSHSSSRLRVIGSVSNSKNFAKSFNCPVGSPMNPKNKCNIWS